MSLAGSNEMLGALGGPKRRRRIGCHINVAMAVVYCRVWGGQTRCNCTTGGSRDAGIGNKRINGLATQEIAGQLLKGGMGRELQDRDPAVVVVGPDTCSKRSRRRRMKEDVCGQQSRLWVDAVLWLMDVDWSCSWVPRWRFNREVGAAGCNATVLRNHTASVFQRSEETNKVGYLRHGGISSRPVTRTRGLFQMSEPAQGTVLTAREVSSMM